MVTLQEVNKLKAYTRNEFDASGDKVILTIKVNKELKELLKRACCLDMEPVSDSVNTGDNENGESQYFNFERYKAKTIFYKELGRYSIKNILYCKELLDTGKIAISFYSVYRQNEVCEFFQAELKTLIELLIGENIEREISFNLDTPTAI
jgi:hypothetical protein